MYVLRMRAYKTKSIETLLWPKHKIEVTTEERANVFAHIETDWIYFFVDLTPPEGL